MTANDLRIKIFADTADLAALERASKHPLVRGFTTNPSLMRKAGVSDYAKFAKNAISIAGNRPVSFEVLSDDIIEVRRQAYAIAEWGDAVYVKVPVVNSVGQSMVPVINDLSEAGVKVNVTAVMSYTQCHGLFPASPMIVSVFAGRVADTGSDPVQAVNDVRRHFWQRDAEVLWASTREVYNVVQADRCSCHIITVTPDLLAKLDGFGKNLDDYSRETAAQFLADARSSGFTI